MREGNLKPGRLLGERYVIIELLAVGGMGAVYLAKDRRLDKTVALKETLFTTDYFRKQFEREALLLAHLNHTGLPKVTDHFIDENGQFLVMEFIVGQDLKALLDERKSPFPYEEVLAWGDQLLDILQYLHSRPTPVFHRDIKPQNLKINDKGKIILIDFGLAKGAASDMTRLEAGNTILGCTREYAPIEQLLRVENFTHQETSPLDMAKLERIKIEYTDQRADLYSLTATMYHLITGFVPITVKDRYLATVQGQPDPLPVANKVRASVPLHVAAFLKKGMAILREERFYNATVMRKALDQVMNYAKTIIEPPLPPGINNPKPQKRDIKQPIDFKGVEREKVKPKAIKINRIPNTPKNKEKDLRPHIDFKVVKKVGADKVTEEAKPKAVKIKRIPNSHKNKV